MEPGTYYVPEGETRHITVVGVRTDTEQPAESLVWVDGTALCILCRVQEAETGDPLILKQFGASQLLLAGLNPSALDPGQEVEIRRYEDGGYDVSLEVDDISDAM